MDAAGAAARRRRHASSTLLAGWSWALAQALADALEAAAADPLASRPWGEAHRPRFAHPLSALFPDAAPLLDPTKARAVGGDGDTVLANGLLPASGPRATYGALARYRFDVGAWDDSRWAVFLGACGHPGSPHYADQHAAWAEARMVAMRYAWPGIAASASARQRLAPG